LPPRPRAESARPAPRAAPAHPRTDARGAGGQRPLLRQRGCLQSPRARDGRRTRAAQDRENPRDGSADRGHGESRLHDADRATGARSRAGPRGEASGHAPVRSTEGAMKIRVRDHVQLSLDRMAKIALASTERALLDLYCVAPGQAQKPHSHAGEDKISFVPEGTGRFSLGGAEEKLEAGDALVAPAGVEHGLVNDGTAPLLVLVVVTPPPPHAPDKKKP